MLQHPDQKFLHEHFKLNEFRLGQKEIISSVVSGRDVLAVLPTGGGKSLCYQYPAVAKGQMVIVVSPLIALMNDQVASLKRMGVPAGCLHSAQSLDEKREVFRQLRAGGPFVLYLSPERTQKDGFREWLKTCPPVALFAIDEAHCVSQWGHDFREEYAQLKNLKEVRPQVPMLALTASATPSVLNDIAKQLALKNPARHVHGFYRPNLFYQVESCADDNEKMLFVRQALAQFSSGRVLIYCGTRRITEDLAESLARDIPGVASYHAGMSDRLRTSVQEEYASSQSRILVATNAFGMGIDHPDVRLVIHYQMPANIDSLYQEMGRAGRDGQPSTCLLLYAKKDKGLQGYFIQSSKAPPAILRTRWWALNNLVDYAEGSECRHAEILTYYQDAQRIERCGHCDVCDAASSRRVVIPPETSEQAYAFTKKSRRRGELIGETSRRVSRATRKAKKGSDLEATVLTPDQNRIFEILRIWRKDKAKELDVPAFVVLSDRSLRHLAKVHPTSVGELEQIYGFGAAKIERFGREILSGPLA